MSIPEQITVGEAMLRARAMYDDGDGGWSVSAIRQYLADRGVERTEKTVRRWVDDAVWERDRAERRRSQAAWRARRTGGRLGRPDHSRQLREFRVRSLAAAGTMHSEIARVMDFDYPDEGWTLERVVSLVGSGPSTPAAPPSPSPPSRREVLERAAELSLKGWTWTAIAQAMTEYHGQAARTGDYWRSAVSYAGLEVRRREMSPARTAQLERLRVGVRRARHGKPPAGGARSTPSREESRVA